MATQITHIATADKLFADLFTQFNKKEFYIGTVFPDIRFLGDISRDATHFYDIDLGDVLKEENSFMAGLKFHCLLDLVREDFVEREGIYSLFTTKARKYTPPKLLEDELFYSKVDNWDEIIGYLDTILPEEESYGVPRQNIEKWHKNLQEYFSQAPSDESRLRHAFGLGISAEMIEAERQSLAELRSIPRAKEIAQEFYDRLEELIESWKAKV